MQLGGRRMYYFRVVSIFVCVYICCFDVFVRPRNLDTYVMSVLSTL